LFLVSASLPAQEARLSGTVSDPSGSVLVGVVVTATQVERNVVFNATTGAEGRYLLPRLPRGTYQVKAEFAGFKTFTQSDMNLTTNSDSLLNIAMALGQVTENVTVSAEASRISTESVTVQHLVDSKRILDLPLNGRDVYQLAALVPGVGRSGTNISGGRSGSQNSTMVNIRVDGTLNVDNAWSIILPSPSPDAVQEFTIQTSVPSARYGFAAGVIEVSTKSGTNQLHGSLYEFLRNDKMDARNFFLPAKTRRKRNQYGFAGGGPVYLPRIYDGRNRTFWFVNVEQMKEPLSAATTIFVPTEAQLLGDFSGAGRVIRDPLNNQPFADNRIPANRLDPVAVNFSRGYVPKPQDGLGTFRYQRPVDNNPTQVLLRGDQSLAEGKHQLSGRMFTTRRSGPAGSGNLPAFQKGVTDNATDLYGLTHTANLSPRMINTARFGFNGYYINPFYAPEIPLDELRKLGFSNNFYTYTPNVPLLNVAGFFQGSVEQIRLSQDYGTFTWSNDFSWIRGRHNIQIGTDGIRTLQSNDNWSRTNGSFTFNGSFSGLALSDFFLGRPSLFRQQNPSPVDLRGMHLAWYIHDDIKVHRRLTLNLGLRHELPRAPNPVNDAASAYRPGAKSQVFVNAPPGMLFYGDPGVPKGGRTSPNKLFAPRVGVVYALTRDQKTTVRSGYGVYVNTSWGNIEGQFTIYPPFARINDVVAPPSTSNPWANYPGGNPHPYTPGRNAIFDREMIALTYGPNFTEPMMQQWNFDVQREIASHWLITAGYVGSRGTHIPYLRDINAPVYIPGQSTVANTNPRRPLHPYYSRLSSIESVINSSYNSLQISVDRRFSRGLSLLLSYTFSKTFADLDSVLTNTGGEIDPDNRRIEWAPANFDRRQALVLSSIWHIPSGPLRRGVAGVIFGNWELNTIWGMYSGPPVSVVSSVDRTLRARPNRPDRIKDPRLPLDRSRAAQIDQYFDRTAYVPNQPGTVGSAPRAEGQLQAPGEVNVTLGIFKNFRGALELHRIQFRTELFNGINRPNFGAPGSNIDTPASFGRITSAADGRIIQLGLKYIF
jgi:hypothetical protein